MGKPIELTTAEFREFAKAKPKDWQRGLLDGRSTFKAFKEPKPEPKRRRNAKPARAALGELRLEQGPPWFLVFEQMPSLNVIVSWKSTGLHWKYKALKERLLRQASGYLLVAGQVNRATGKRQVDIWRYSGRRLDHDRLVGGCVPLVDALVRAGWLRGDTLEDVQVLYHQGSGEKRTVVAVREIE